MALPLAAVQNKDGNSVVFFKNQSGFLTSKTSVDWPEVGTGSGNPSPYQVDNIKAFTDSSKTGQPAFVQLGGSDVCAHSYWYSAVKDPTDRNYKLIHSIRLFYLNPEGVVQELCQDDGKEWFFGSLGKGANQPTAKKDTGISCHISSRGSGKNLVQYQKVYFCDTTADVSKFDVAWTLLGDTAATENWKVKTQI